MYRRANEFQTTELIFMCRKIYVDHLCGHPAEEFWYWDRRGCEDAGKTHGRSNVPSGQPCAHALEFEKSITAEREHRAPDLDFCCGLQGCCFRGLKNQRDDMRQRLSDTQREYTSLRKEPRKNELSNELKWMRVELTRLESEYTLQHGAHINCDALLPIRLNDVRR